VSVYTKIGAKVYEITNQKKRLWEDAEQLVKNVQTFSEEVIAQKKEEIAALETRYQEVKTQHDTDKKKCDWLKTDAELAGKAKKATEDSVKAAVITQSEDFKKEEGLVSQWQATIEARSWLTTKNKAKRDIEEGKTAIGKQQDIIDAENKKLAETLNPAFEKAGRETETAKVLFERQQVALQSQEANLAVLNLSGLRKQREEAKDLQQNIKTANELVTSVAEAKEKVENARQSLAKSLASIEESDEFDGLLLLLNTVGGDIEAGLAIAEMIAGMKKPTVSLVLGGGHSIGIPLAVCTKKSFITPTASMTVHPVRMTGLVVGAPQTFRYFQRIQEQIADFVTNNSQISKKDFERYMMATGEMATDVGTILYGKEAVSSGLIDKLGGLNDALMALHKMIEKQKR
jgi:ATP-dependent protease ClpP protease subunit